MLSIVMVKKTSLLFL